MREYLARLLRSAGYQVEAVTDGQQALEAVRADVPDLVVSDVMMPRLDGLALVAALRADPRTAAVPGAAVVGTRRAGGVDRRPAGRRRRLSRQAVRGRRTARPRARPTSNWRGCATTTPAGARPWSTRCRRRSSSATSSGAVIEINAAFTDILGYGTDGLPYEPIHPWWPSADTDPDAHRQVAGGIRANCSTQTHGTFTIPVNHRDGHRLWVTVNFNHAEDPDTGRRVMVGTFRDVTAEHYTVQRETALAALNQQLVPGRHARRRRARGRRGAAQAVAGAPRAGRRLARRRAPNPLRRNSCASVSRRMGRPATADASR